MIVLKNVTKIYGKDFVAVDNLSLEIKDGEIFGFLGPNGAGKTTTLKLLSGILPLDSGEIFLNEFNIVKDPIEAKKTLGFIPDTPNVLPRLKGREYLEFITSVYKIDKETATVRIEQLAKKFDLYDSLNDRVESYSHGMLQKLLVIGVLLHNPKNWVLDEPMTGLDPKSSFLLKEMMREHADNGNTVLFSTHVLDVAEKICDRIGIINKGKLIFVGTIAELKELRQKDDSLEKLFLEFTDNE
ncbi:MAG: ABC transporter ATP-binding protein [Bacilli bacterium]|jgi:ABC-2 type transport system ATP-binding protein